MKLMCKYRCASNFEFHCKWSMYRICKSGIVIINSNLHNVPVFTCKSSVINKLTEINIAGYHGNSPLCKYWENGNHGNQGCHVKR